MEPFSTSLLIFTIVVVGAMGAMAVGPSLRPHHISAETRDVVKLGIGMVSAMSALILGLTVSSVMSSYNLTERDVQQYATDLVNLDGALRDYGAGADAVRADLQHFTVLSLAEAWPARRSLMPGAEETDVEQALSAIGTAISDLPGDTADAAQDRGAAVAMYRKVQQDRWKIGIESYSSVNPVMIVVVAVWLTLIFMSFGLFAPRNIVSVLFLIICPACIAGTIYLILDLNTPFEGTTAIAPVPLERALLHQQRP